MSKYKVGDVAALFSKPKEPTTEAGKKLQALFKEFHDKDKSIFQSQKATSRWNNKSEAEKGDQRTFKKNKKRKFSASADQEINNDHNLKKFKGTDRQEEGFKIKEKKNNVLEERDFPRKKQKASKLNSINSNSFIKSEMNGSSENDFKSTAILKSNNSSKEKKRKLSFIKKSKQQTYFANNNFDKGCSKNSKVKKDTFDSNDESFKEEIKEFIKSNSKKSKKKNSGNVNSEKDLKKTLEEGNSSFVRNSPNKHESEANSNLKNSPKNKNQATDFIRKPKNRNKIINSNFGRDDDDKKCEMSNKKAFDSNDNLFKSENEQYHKNDTKKFKKKFSNANNSVQNLPRKLPVKREPDFVKLLDRNPEDDDKLSRTLFVGNLPLNTRLNELKDLFSQFGEVEFIRFKGIETDKAKIFSENAPKLLNANYAADSVPGFIIFKERESAVNAIALCGTVFKNRHITVDFAMPAGSKKLYDEKRSIFIGNLPFDVNDESIWNAFSDCGRIEGVRVVRDKETGIGKGFGYVLFSTVESRKNAMSLKDLMIEGRLIRIKAVDSNKGTQKKSDMTTTKRDTFKSRAIRFKKKHKNTNSNSRKSIKKLVKKEKTMHKKKKIASFLQKSMQ